MKEGDLDNFHVDITSEGSLADVMKIAFGKYRQAEGYLVSPEKGLVFFWLAAHETAVGLVKLPFKMSAANAAIFAEQWLSQTDYGPEPDHDGDNGRGWRVYNEAWGRVNAPPMKDYPNLPSEDWTYSFIAVQPVWAMYGK